MKRHIQDFTTFSINESQGLDDALFQAVNKRGSFGIVDGGEFDDKMLPVIKTLLDNGADPNLLDPGDAPILFTAIDLLDADVVELLLAAGADPTTPHFYDIVRYDEYGEEYEEEEDFSSVMSPYDLALIRMQYAKQVGEPQQITAASRIIDLLEDAK